MDISSVNQYGSLANLQYGYTTTSNSNTGLDTQLSGNDTGTVPGVLSNTDGDSFELSITANVSATFSQYNQQGGSVLHDFLEKVKNGTVTDSDLKDMQSKLNSAPAPAGTAKRHHSHGDGSALKSFMDKVKNGTVTQDDLTTMQNKLNSTSNETGAASGQTSDGDAIKSFLDKVKAGTITDNDLTDMQNKLNTMQNSNGADQSHKHRGHGNAVQNFLDKVKAGTITADDLQTLQNEMNSWRQPNGGTTDSGTSGNDSNEM